MNRSYIGGYWGPRAESLEDCLDRSIAYLEDLAACHKLLATWYRRATSPAASLSQPVEPSQEGIDAELLNGRNRRDSDGSVIEALGYRLGAWNGWDNTHAATLDILCGATSPRLLNSVLLDLPQSRTENDGLYEFEASRRLVECLIRRWDPDWATFTSDELRKQQRSREEKRVVLGQHTYLAERRGTVPPLPAPFVTLQLHGIGTIVSIVGVETSAELIDQLIKLLVPDLLRK